MDTTNNDAATESGSKPEGSSSGSTHGGSAPSGTPQGGRPKPPSWAQSRNSSARPNIDSWYKPEEGAELDGVMAFHDSIFDDRTGKPRRIFIVRKADGRHVGVGERSGIVRMRHAPVGSRVWLYCLGRRKTGRQIAGEDQTIIDFDLRLETELPRPIEVATPTAPARSNTAPSGYYDAPPASDDDGIPF